MGAQKNTALPQNLPALPPPIVNDRSLILFIIPSGKLPVQMWRQILEVWINYLIQGRVFVAAENGSVEVLKLVALFLLKTETFGAKNW